MTVDPQLACDKIQEQLDLLRKVETADQPHPKGYLDEMQAFLACLRDWFEG